LDIRNKSQKKAARKSILTAFKHLIFLDSFVLGFEAPRKETIICSLYDNTKACSAGFSAVICVFSGRFKIPVIGDQPILLLQEVRLLRKNFKDHAESSDDLLCKSSCGHLTKVLPQKLRLAQKNFQNFHTKIPPKKWDVTAKIY